MAQSENQEQVEEPAFKPDDTLKGIYGPDGKPQFFADPVMDHFLAVMMNMAQELWVQEERLLALEKAKEAKDNAPPSTANTREAKEFIERIFAPLRERE